MHTRLDIWCASGPFWGFRYPSSWREGCESSGQRATKPNQSQNTSGCLGQPKEKDGYGRLVARVRVDSLDVSLELVKAGLAWHYKKYSSDPELAAAEQQARAEGVGVWSLADPIPPWEQRRGSSGNWERAVESSSQSGTVYHGNLSGHIYHAPGCRYYNCKNCTREFRSKQEAQRAVYPG